MGYIIGYSNILVQAVTLLLALLSLAAGHDEVPPIVPSITLPLSIFLLLLLGVITAILRSLSGRRPRS